MNTFSSFFLRLTLAVLFFWFGIKQLIDPGMWMSFLPEWTGYLPMPGEMLVRLNGWFECVLATMLLCGLFTRFSAGVLGLHLVGIAITAGGAIGVRDAALAGACFAVLFGAADAWTLDAWLKGKVQRSL